MEQTYIKQCELCGDDCEVKQDKRRKLYYTCANCVTQTFVRGQEGMMRLMQTVQTIKAEVEHEETHTSEETTGETDCERATSEDTSSEESDTGFGFFRS